MIETVVALCMFVAGELKEHRIQNDGMAQCLKGKREAERVYKEKALKLFKQLQTWNNTITI